MSYCVCTKKNKLRDSILCVYHSYTDVWGCGKEGLNHDLLVLHSVLIQPSLDDLIQFFHLNLGMRGSKTIAVMMLKSGCHKNKRGSKTLIITMMLNVISTETRGSKTSGDQ